MNSCRGTGGPISNRSPQPPDLRSPGPAYDAESIIDCYRDTIDSWLTEGESDRVSIREMIGILTEQIKVHIEVELYGIV